MSEVKLEAVYLIIPYLFASRAPEASPICPLAHDLGSSLSNLFQSGSHPNHSTDSGHSDHFCFLLGFPKSTVLVTQSCPTLWTPWAVVCQAPLSMKFSRQEYYCIGKKKKKKAQTSVTVYTMDSP